MDEILSIPECDELLQSKFTADNASSHSYYSFESSEDETGQQDLNDLKLVDDTIESCVENSEKDEMDSLSKYTEEPNCEPELNENLLSQCSEKEEKGPMYVPRNAKYFCHDDRCDEVSQFDGSHNQNFDPEEIWVHDMFDPLLQAPKSTSELIESYGCDIRLCSLDDLEKYDLNAKLKSTKQWKNHELNSIVEGAFENAKKNLHLEKRTIDKKKSPVNIKSKAFHHRDKGKSSNQAINHKNSEQDCGKKSSSERSQDCDYEQKFNKTGYKLKKLNMRVSLLEQENWDRNDNIGLVGFDDIHYPKNSETQSSHHANATVNDPYIRCKDRFEPKLKKFQNLPITTHTNSVLESSQNVFSSESASSTSNIKTTNNNSKKTINSVQLTKGKETNMANPQKNLEYLSAASKFNSKTKNLITVIPKKVTSVPLRLSDLSDPERLHDIENLFDSDALSLKDAKWVSTHSLSKILQNSKNNPPRKPKIHNVKDKVLSPRMPEGKSGHSTKVFYNTKFEKESDNVCSDHLSQRIESTAQSLSSLNEDTNQLQNSNVILQTPENNFHTIVPVSDFCGVNRVCDSAILSCPSDYAYHHPDNYCCWDQTEEDPLPIFGNMIDELSSPMPPYPGELLCYHDTLAPSMILDAPGVPQYSSAAYVPPYHMSLAPQHNMWVCIQNQTYNAQIRMARSPVLRAAGRGRVFPEQTTVANFPISHRHLCSPCVPAPIPVALPPALSGEESASEQLLTKNSLKFFSKFVESKNSGGVTSPVCASPKLNPKRYSVQRKLNKTISI